MCTRGSAHAQTCPYRSSHLSSCPFYTLVRCSLAHLLSFQEPQAEDSVSCRGLELWYPEVSGLGLEGGGTFGRECGTLAARARLGKVGQAKACQGVGSWTVGLFSHWF